ncbi:MAG: hypothetical protein JXB47_13665 [Anaerolineae bacterium]|nr:hypothetical protein [Anaerolineae bacterium]
MTQKSMPFDGTGAGDSGPYDAAHDREFFRRFFGFSADEYLRGVMLAQGNGLEVVPSSPAGKSVVVKSGAALVNGSLHYNDAGETLVIDNNTSGYTRVDRVVVDLDYASNETRLAVVKGPEDGSGAPDDLEQDPTGGGSGHFQIPLARVTVADGFSTITATEIEDDRYYANLAPVLGVDLTNGSGAEVTYGAVVLRGSADRYFTTGNTAAVSTVIGVALERIPNTGTGKIAPLGSGAVVKIKVTGTVARGDRLNHAAATGRAKAGDSNGFAVALSENASGDGEVWAMLLPGGGGAGGLGKVPLIIPLFGGNEINYFGSGGWQQVAGSQITLNAEIFEGAASAYLMSCIYSDNAAGTASCQLYFGTTAVSGALVSTTSATPVELTSSDCAAALKALSGSNSLFIKVTNSNVSYKCITRGTKLVIYYE